MTCRYSPQYSLLSPTARAAGTRKVDNADSLAGIGNGHRAPDSIQLESRGKYEGMVELYRSMLGPRGLSVCFNSWAFLNSSACRSRSRSACDMISRRSEG